MLTPYCETILVAELGKADYAPPMTKDQGFAWLTQPYPVSVTMPNPIVSRASLKAYAMLTGKLMPILAATTASAKTLQLLFVDPDFPQIDTTSALWLSLTAGLVADGLLIPADVAALNGLGAVTVTTTMPARYDQRFSPVVWPSVNPTTGAVDATGASPAIHGFPNGPALLQADFDAAWIAAGRS